MLSSRRKPATIRVLLIEDNRDDALLVKHALGESTEDSFQIDAAVRVTEAIELLSQSNYDVILSDLSLPDSTGIETFHEIREAAEGVPIVILSGNRNDALAVEALEQGVQDYIVKHDFNGELLVRTLRYAITRHRLTVELKDSEQRLRMMTEQLPAILWTTDADLRITSLRGQELETLGVDAERLVGAEVQDLFPARTPTTEPKLPGFDPGFDIAGRCYPTERCSGDFLDYIPLSGERLAIFLAGVSGNGFGPAIMPLEPSHGRNESPSSWDCNRHSDPTEDRRKTSNE